LLILKRLVKNSLLYIDNKYQKHYRVVFDNLFDKDDYYIGTIKLDNPDNTFLTTVRTKIDFLLSINRIHQKLNVEALKWRFLTRENDDPIVPDDERELALVEVFFKNQNM
jgi:hypothetical protein